MTERSRGRLSRLSRLHGWLGAFCVAFVVILSVTGIALNHTSDFGLDNRHIQASWLLDWYGLDAPAPGPSFEVTGSLISQLGERLYLGSEEIAQDIHDLVGAVRAQSLVVVGMTDEILVSTPHGELVERLDVASLLPGELIALGTLGSSLILEIDGALYETDENLLTISPCPEIRRYEVAWSAPSLMPRELLAELQQQYRGTGVTLERLLLDIHSGKILSRAGPLLLDAVGVLLLVLSFLGLYTWIVRVRRDAAARKTRPD